jgi:hypothetical protein
MAELFVAGKVLFTTVFLPGLVLGIVYLTQEKKEDDK